jgi:hypothetical protein
VIPAELWDFCESGISTLLGTHSDRLVPDCGRALGARVGAGGSELTVFLPVATSEKSIANLRDNGRAAVCFARASDHRSLQVKGRVTDIREADEEDRERIVRYRNALAESWGAIGVPPRITLRLTHWPSYAVTIRVEAVFDQTPGPGAGAVFGTPAR